MTKGGSFKRALRQEARAAEALGRLKSTDLAWRAVAGGRPPAGSERWWPDTGSTDAIAERVAGR